MTDETLTEASRELRPGHASLRALCAFSGGKDSCLALWHAQRLGWDVRALLVMLEEDGVRSRSHGLPVQLIERQASALGLKLFTRNASWANYEQVFTATLRELELQGYGAIVFGDIDLQEHRDWEERVCRTAGLRAVLPLWQRNRATLAREAIELGFRSIVVCVDSEYLPDEFCGREYDASFLADLPRSVDVCGENGEFHTFVYDGPNFAHPVEFELVGKAPYYAPEAHGGRRYCIATLAPPPVSAAPNAT